MVTKILSFGVIVGLVNLMPFTVTTASAGNAGWHGASGFSQRTQFRPWSHASRPSRVSRWRPSASPAPRKATGLASPGSPITQVRVGPRSVHRVRAQSWPVTADTTRFRPDRRTLPDQRNAGVGQSATALQFQFRPAQTRRKPTYEQLFARGGLATQPYARRSVAAYTGAHMPGYAAYWASR
jgi:hypothetical protein